jgi:hypothetical protein
MKYWNKDKETRRTHWTKVSHPRKYVLMSLPGGWARMPSDVSTQELKRWCQLQPSTGKFYHYYGADSWWFERPEDATFFVLRWS